MTISEAFDMDEARFCSLRVDGDRVMFYRGFKAIKCPDGSVKIYDTSGDGPSYSEMTSHQYSMVEQYGFRETVKQLKIKSK
jgi:hypothetical protein